MKNITDRSKMRIYWIGERKEKETHVWVYLSTRTFLNSNYGDVMECVTEFESSL
jgi:hypothetical protein